MSCSAKYVLKNCMCLPDPLNYYSTVCAYISKENGLLYPCDPGCCRGACDNTNPIIQRVETRPSAGIDLPEGYGFNLPQSEDPSAFPGATDLRDLPGARSEQSIGGYKIWQILLMALVPLAVVLLSSFLA